MQRVHIAPISRHVCVTALRESGVHERLQKMRDEVCDFPGSSFVSWGTRLDHLQFFVLTFGGQHESTKFLDQAHAAGYEAEEYKFDSRVSTYEFGLMVPKMHLARCEDAP